MRSGCIALTFVFSLALAATALAQEFPVDPYGDCCVAKVTMVSWDAWDVTCGSCATNPGVYRVTQPDPDKNVYVDASGQQSDSPNDLALKLCNCPSLDKVRAFRRSMRMYHGN